MKKNYKRTENQGKIHILHWETDGVLFGPCWASIAVFENTHKNLERCKTIVRLMNECDKHTDHPDNDRERDT